MPRPLDAFLQRADLRPLRGQRDVPNVVQPPPAKVVLHVKGQRVELLELLHVLHAHSVRGVLPVESAVLEQLLQAPASGGQVVELPVPWEHEEPTPVEVEPHRRERLTRRVEYWLKRVFKQRAVPPRIPRAPRPPPTTAPRRPEVRAQIRYREPWMWGRGGTRVTVCNRRQHGK